MESHDLVSKAAKAAHEGLIPAMVEQFERNTTDFLQGEYPSHNPFGHKAGIGMMMILMFILLSSFK